MESESQSIFVGTSPTQISRTCDEEIKQPKERDMFVFKTGWLTPPEPEPPSSDSEEYPEVVEKNDSPEEYFDCVRLSKIALAFRQHLDHIPKSKLQACLDEVQAIMQKYMDDDVCIEPSQEDCGQNIEK